MSDGNLADNAGDPLDDTAASVTQPKGEARIAQPLTAKPYQVKADIAQAALTVAHQSGHGASQCSRPGGTGPQSAEKGALIGGE
jgi:hypothetical protein